MRTIFNLKFLIFNKKQEGMTLFISIIIMGLLLLISFAVVNITLKGTLFSSTGRDSHYAFYAADSGIECAVYWDTRFDPSKFATSTAGGSTITCLTQTIFTGSQTVPTLPASVPSLIGGGGDANQTSIFYINMNNGTDPVPYCAIVTVRKYYVGSSLVTYIKSRGYNTCDTTNPRRVERGVEVTY